MCLYPMLIKIWSHLKRIYLIPFYVVYLIHLLYQLEYSLLRIKFIYITWLICLLVIKFVFWPHLLLLTLSRQHLQLSFQFLFLLLQCHLLLLFLILTIIFIILVAWDFLILLIINFVLFVSLPFLLLLFKCFIFF